MIELSIVCGPEVVKRLLAGEESRIHVREKFATRRDDHLIRVRFAADGPAGPVKTVATRDVPERFHARSYVSFHAKHMPKVLSRIGLIATLDDESTIPAKME